MTARGFVAMVRVERRNGVVAVTIALRQLPQSAACDVRLRSQSRPARRRGDHGNGGAK